VINKQQQQQSDQNTCVPQLGVNDGFDGLDDVINV
jgi:hypothetical protein